MKALKLVRVTKSSSLDNVEKGKKLLHADCFYNEAIQA